MAQNHSKQGALAKSPDFPYQWNWTSQDLPLVHDMLLLWSNCQNVFPLLSFVNDLQSWSHLWFCFCFVQIRIKIFALFQFRYHTFYFWIGCFIVFAFLCSRVKSKQSPISDIKDVAQGIKGIKGNKSMLLSVETPSGPEKRYRVWSILVNFVQEK